MAGLLFPSVTLMLRFPFTIATKPHIQLLTKCMKYDLFLKSVVAHLVKKYPAFYGTRFFYQHESSSTPTITFLIFSSRLCLGLFVRIDRMRLRLLTAASNGLIVYLPGDTRKWKATGMIPIGKSRKTRRKTCPSAILATTNTRSVTNRLSHGTSMPRSCKLSLSFTF